MDDFDKKKPSVLILLPHFLPGYKMGGPLTSILHIISNLSPFFDFKVLTSDRDMGDETPYENIPTNTWTEKDEYEVCYVNSGKSKVREMVKFINNSEADSVYLNSLFDPVFSIAIAVLAKFGVVKAKKIIIAPRGEVFDEALNFKKTKKKFYLAFAKLFKVYSKVTWHASTEHEKAFVVKKLGVNPDQIKVALNLPAKSDKPTLLPSDKKKEEDILYIVFIARVSKDKNLIYTFDILKEIKTKVIFDIYGPLEDDFIWEACKEKIAKLPDNVKVNYNGPLASTSVRKTFNDYDLMFMPTFAENYGHAIVECLTMGTPVLISDNTPWRELEKQNLGYDISLDEPATFVDAVRQMASLSQEEKLANRKKRIEDFYLVLNDGKTLEANKKLFTI